MLGPDGRKQGDVGASGIDCLAVIGQREVIEPGAVEQKRAK